MEKIVTINNEQLKAKIIDKKLQNTLVCIHGFSSNSNFIGQLDKHLNNFNIISISYENLSELKIDHISRTIEHFFTHYLKKTKVYVLGHSLGGLFAARIANLKKVKGVYMLNPVHPLLWETKPFVKLQKVIEAKSKISKSTINLIIKLLKTRSPRLVKFVDPESSWFAVTIDLVTKRKDLKTKLLADYDKMKAKTIFLVSKVDNVISADSLLPYLQEFEFKHHIIDYDGHSPLLRSSEIVAPYFLNVKRKRRWVFWNKLLKLNH